MRILGGSSRVTNPPGHPKRPHVVRPENLPVTVQPPPRPRRPGNRILARSTTLTLLVGALALAAPPTAPAHEIPADVTILSFVGAQGETLRILVRVPLVSMRDVEFPVRGPGYVDMERTGPLLDDQATIWIAGYLELYEDGRLLPAPRVAKTRISLPSDRSFMGYEAALAHMDGDPVSPETNLVLEQALLDVLLEVPITNDQARFSMVPQWAHLGLSTRTVLRFLPAGGNERALQYEGNPGLIRLDPRWHQAAFSFARLGFLHILEGLDHILFILCLVIPFRKFVPLVPVVTAFTLAHSITLGAAAFGVAPTALWFPPLIETLIALSIVFMAFENIAGARQQRRWMVAFGFGLIHGFGFSFLLRESMQFAGDHLVASLVFFNLGVELGQLFFILLAIPILHLLFRYVVAERVGTILLSALVAHTAWHWMTDRGANLGAYSYSLPPFDALFLTGLLRAGLLLLIIAAVAWGLFEVSGRWERWASGAGGGDAKGKTLAPDPS